MDPPEMSESTKRKAHARPDVPIAERALRPARDASAFCAIAAVLAGTALVACRKADDRARPDTEARASTATSAFTVASSAPAAASSDTRVAAFGSASAGAQEPATTAPSAPSASVSASASASASTRPPIPPIGHMYCAGEGCPTRP
jgi:hypothetical protein